MTDTPSSTPETLTCYNHPQRETLLRCNRCERPICQECSQLTPTGYRCKECLRGQQKVFETAQTWDYPAAILIAGGLSFLGSLLVSFLGFFTLLISPVVGMLIVEAVRKVTRRRRSKRLFQLAAGAAVLGALPVLGLSLLGGGIFGIIWPALYTVFIASTVYSRLSGIQLR